MNYFETTYDGEITGGGVAAVCPSCSARTGLTVHGRAGGQARLRCPRRHDFAVPRGIDARRLLADSINDSRRVRTN
jgi:hypothetical protein